MPAPTLPKLELAPLWPVLAAVLAATAVLWIHLPDLVEESAAEQLVDSIEVLAPVVAPRAASEPAGLQEWIDRLAGTGDLRITMVASDGTVLADSERTPEQVAAMDNHLDRPEIAAALASGTGRSVRRSATIGISYAYAARSLTAPDGRLYALRLAKPLDELSIFKRRLAGGLALGLAAGLLAAGAVFLWLTGRLFRPAARLADGAAAMAAGDYSQRLDPPEEPRLALLAETLNRLAARVEEQIAAVRSERDHLKAIVRSMSDGVLVTDREGRALLTNPELRRLFGLARDPRGRLPLEIARLPDLAELVQATLERGEGFTVTTEVRQPERRILALSSAALSPPRGPRAAAGGGEPGTHGFDPDGIHGAVVVARDITQATRLDEMRRDFVANVSHELKTPLSAIRGFAETLRDGALDDPPAASRFTDRILDQCRRLQALLDDLLTLSRLESADHRFEPAPVDLQAVARRAVETVDDTARSRGVSVGLDTPERSLPAVPGDREDLERLLLNLVENGVKYNREGGRVVVTLGTVSSLGEGGEESVGGPSGENRTGAADQVVIEVADTGIGIPDDAVDRIFERFYRVDRGRARSGKGVEGGTGLGLSIVKHIVQSHGGRIELQTELGVGTTFRVFLPLDPPVAPRHAVGRRTGTRR